jgi:hypothetical protein
MEQPGKPGCVTGWWDLAWLLAWGIASAGWCLTAAAQLGPTYDETVHVEQGLYHWRTGDHGTYMGPGTMPLPLDVDTLPLYLWECWRGVPFAARDDLAQLLPWARATALGFWWLLLTYAWRAGRQLAGSWGGRLAVALLASEPLLLGHAGLATTDIALSACLLALVYHYRTGRTSGFARRVALPALWFGLTVATKASGLVFGPLCLLAVELERLVRSGAFRLGDTTGSPGGWRCRLGHTAAVLRPSIGEGAMIVAGGLMIVLLLCGNDRHPLRPLATSWAAWLPEGPVGRLIAGVGEHVRSLPNGFHGLRAQFRHNASGHGWIFLAGVSRTEPFWYYFPLALTMKLTLSLLLLPALVAAVRARALFNWAGVAALALLAFTPLCQVQIGVRLVLPLVVLGTVGMAAALVEAWQVCGAGCRRLLSGGAGAGVAWAAAAALLVWPHGLCYTNELWGGTAQGYRLLTDSNYDWGQGLPELARWQRDHDVDQLDVWYFGTDPALKKLPLREVRLHLLPLDGPEGVRTEVEGHYLAVSTTWLHGLGEPTAAGRYLRTCQPVGRTMTYFIYDFTRSAHRRPTIELGEGCAGGQ